MSKTLTHRWKRAGVAAASSVAGIVVFAAAIDVLPAIPSAIPVIAVISAIAAGVAALLRPMTWRRTSILGAAIGIVGAYIYGAYAVSQI